MYEVEAEVDRDESTPVRKGGIGDEASSPGGMSGAISTAQALQLRGSAGNTATAAKLSKPASKARSKTRSLVNKIQAAVRKDDGTKAAALSSQLHKLDPAFYRGFLAYKLAKHPIGDKKRLPYAGGPILDALRESIYAGEPHARMFVGMIGFIPSAERVIMAKKDPAFFLAHVVKPLRDVDTRNFRDVLVDAYVDPTQKALIGPGGQATDASQLRAVLRAGAPSEWKEFAASVPLLAPAEKARVALSKSKKAPTVFEVVDHIFDNIVANGDISIGYFATSKDATEDIMMGRSGGSAADTSGLDEPLRTQCDDIMKITRDAIRAYPDLDVTFKIGMEKQALLTKPLAGVPGGLIPKTFKGNVQLANGKWTNQIFFTGVTETKEPNSHTWLVINGRPYDAVLGTRGADVEAARQGSFTQVSVKDDTGTKWEKVWRDPAGNTLKILDGVKPPANPMGFGTAYRYTPKV